MRYSFFLFFQCTPQSVINMHTAQCAKLQKLHFKQLYSSVSVLDTKQTNEVPHITLLFHLLKVRHWDPDIRPSLANEAPIHGIETQNAGRCVCSAE